MPGQSFVKTMITLEMCYRAWRVFHHQKTRGGGGVGGIRWGEDKISDIERR